MKTPRRVLVTVPGGVRFLPTRFPVCGRSRAPGKLLSLSAPAKEGQTSSLLRPYPAEAMTAYPVDTRVNSPKHNDAACVAPLAV